MVNLKRHGVVKLVGISINSPHFLLPLGLIDRIELKRMKSGKENLLTGYTGKSGDTGFYKRVVNGVEIIQRCPKKKKFKNHQEWPDQVKRFYLATKYASGILQNQEIRALYEKVADGFNSATSMAIKDYLKPSVIGRVVTSGYLGRAGYRIVIRVDNVVPVKSVKVTIESPQGETIETGQAIMQSSGIHWHYVTTRPNQHHKGSLIRIVSRDLPGNPVEWIRVF